MRNPEHIASVGLAVAMISLSAAMSTAQGQDPYKAGVCAEREITLEMLIESDRAPPNASSAKLAENANAVIEARIDCDFGRTNEAVAIYDRIISEVTTALRSEK